MGEMSQCVFVTEILSEFRSRGIDLTQIAHNKAAQEGLTLDDSAAVQHFARVMAAQLHAWIPVSQQDVQLQTMQLFKPNLLLWKPI